MGAKFKTVAVGGTFDELHKGHRTLLIKAFEISNHVIIGLCSDQFVARMSKSHITASYQDRFADLKSFLEKNGLWERAEIVRLNDPYGGTLAKDGIEALVVSKETEATALEINKRRKKLMLAPLQIVTIDMVPSENNSPISTTRIRRGEIDREGRLLKTCSK
jgi:pantetheine-phosphate adenylyltransferase